MHCVTKHVAWLFFSLADFPISWHALSLCRTVLYWSAPLPPLFTETPRLTRSFKSNYSILRLISKSASLPNTSYRWSKGSDKSLTQAYPASASEPTGETCVRGTHFSKYGCVSGSGDSRTVWFLSLDSHQSSAPKDGVFWVQGLPSRDCLFPWFIPSLLSSGLKPAPCRV